MKKMLISASHTGELRVAVIKGKKLQNLDIEHLSNTRKKGNMYVGQVKSIEPSLNAAFINYGSDRQGFLPIKEVAPGYFPEHLQNEDPSKVSIQDVLKEGQKVLVEIKRDERGNKGAALSTFISLAGSYLVLMPKSPRAGGVSRRIESEDRQELRDTLDQLQLPEDMGVIVRTAGVGKSVEELQWDLTSLLSHWQAIQQAAEEYAPPQLIHQESDTLMRAIRDYLRQDTTIILVDSPEVFERAKSLLERIKPEFVERLELHQDPVPLFTQHGIEHQVQSMYQREIRLPSGGSIAIDHTEALVAIDINSARATTGGDIEETALNTNIEATEEIARQLRLRDIGGLIVIDFIDMTPPENQREVENQLREALRSDRARIQMTRISRFGLLELSRQRLHSSFGEAHQKKCPRCSGRGNIQSVEALTVSLLNIIEEETLNESVIRVHLHVPVNVATFMLNEKRDYLSEIEARQNMRIVVIPTPHLESPHYKLEKVYSSGKARESYKMITEAEPMQETETFQKTEKAHNSPVVKTRLPASPPPRPKKTVSLTQMLKQLFVNKTKVEKPQAKGIQQGRRQPQSPNRQQQRRRPQQSRSNQGRNQQQRSR